MIVGIDEVGRGCWAGPLVAAAIAFPASNHPAGLNDSKKLTMNQRLRLNVEINEATSLIGIGWVWPEEINKIGLSKSVEQAMRRALKQIPITPSVQIIIDGNIDYLKFKNSKAIIKADGNIAEVSAASIVAKVARDSYMHELSELHPEYGFEKHVGYGTRLHIEALRLHGILADIHRLNYKPIQRFIAERG